MEHKAEKVMENKQRVFTQPKNAGAALLFSVLVLSCPGNAQIFNESNFTYSFIDGGQAARIDSYTMGSVVNLIIPDMLGGKPVTEIGTSVFSGKTVLQSVSFPNSLASIGKQAFFGCSGLTQLTLPDSLLFIGEFAFQNCTGLTQTAIPASVTTISAGSFLGCSALTQISIHSNSLHFSSQDGVLFNKEQTVLYQYSGGKFGPYTLPGSVEIISRLAFASCGELTEVTIPASVDIIEDSAFIDCTKLRTVLFEGHAPGELQTSIFLLAAAEFKVQFYEGARGFSTPFWRGYSSESLPPTFPIWRIFFGFEAGDLNAANGEPLLLAYALNLNPTNSAVRLPSPFVEGAKIRLDFPVDRPGVLLLVERAADLLAGFWRPVEIDINGGTGSVLMPFAGSESPEKLFLRFTVQQAE